MIVFFYLSIESQVLIKITYRYKSITSMSQPPNQAFEVLFKNAQQDKAAQPPAKKQESSLAQLKVPGMQQRSKPVSHKEAKSEYEDAPYLGVNQILYFESKKEKVFYVPCYIRLKVNRVSQINYIEVCASIETEIRLWLMLNQFPKAVQEQIINLTKLQINGGDAVHALSQIPEPPKLDHTYKKNVSKRAIGFMITEEMNLDIESDPFWSPFELVKLVANLQMKKIQLGDHDQEFLSKIDAKQRQKYKGATVQFNFMDAHPFLQFSFGQVNHLGSFDIAESLVDMEFSNEAIKQTENQEQQQAYSEVQQARPLAGGLMQGVINQTLGLKQKIRRQKIEKGLVTPDAYEHGQILIPLYKYPAMTIINVFLPFYMVAILNLGVFFEANDMSNRSASLATFQLAYIAFFPTIRQTLPQTPKLVFAQFLIYIQALCTLICFFYSLNINMVEGYVFVWSTDAVFLVCLSLTIANIATVVVMFLLHKTCWQPAYNKLPDGAVQCMLQTTLNTDDTEEWWNPRCEQEFKHFIAKQFVKPAFPRKKKKKVINPFAILFGAAQKHQEYPSS